MNKPVIRTAIPRRRYRLGEFQITVLDDIESNDGRDYRYIMAVIHGEDPEPGMYLTAEQPAGRDSELVEMRLIMHDGEQTIGEEREWRHIDRFVEQGIEVVSKILNLSDEVPWQLQ